ncbi:MarR family transcriptional regulator [Mycobacterium sp. 852013-50091_SCH5140682]|uniref:MarR family winged helix-turn-helix transcriptional regulator n=1 Tax=Mycobacterium sp. 852013-50091_SCH5140682 TaxID=1834109 RepID=UPI0007EA81DE|nr:MarR family transcriptional regulator [Mycobacterium sp. 852013-50091_SCH5140682]OBC11528.1 MarR family transcriptional regulator [Mycobacterium sp. 852013-50091_SCH5140682]
MDESTSDDPVDAIAAAWRRELPHVSVESIGIVTRVWQIAKLLGDDRARLLRARDADMATLDLLSTLRRHGKPYRMTTRELAAASLITAGAITQRVDRAEKQGLVRRAGRHDSRAVDVELTELGHETADELVAAVLARECELLQGLSRGQRQQLASMLKALLGHLSDELGVRERPGHVGHHASEV